MMLAIVLALAQDTPSVDSRLKDSTFEPIRDGIVPTADELRYKKIPWRPTLWDALLDAQKAEKPILFYAMNGHPLACT